MKRNFEDLDKPLPDGTIPIYTLFDMAVKQIHEDMELSDTFSCEFAEDFSDITFTAHSTEGIRFMMMIWKKDWNICFYANVPNRNKMTTLHSNDYPLYQKLFDWGFLQVNTK